ncbi:MAG: hypothetical protein J07HB67_02403 [halophilic archaeon J07HB67]|jgi:hypothetical protein|nr:MAG: hypothetical protein J07HB67_02403 [halophilic archaeon J07HB67]
MPTKAVGSHTLSALVALFAGQVLSKYVSEVLPSLGEASRVALTAVNSLPAVSIPHGAEAAGTVLVIVAVTAVWEITHLLRTRA